MDWEAGLDWAQMGCLWQAQHRHRRGRGTFHCFLNILMVHSKAGGQMGAFPEVTWRIRVRGAGGLTRRWD